MDLRHLLKVERVRKSVISVKGKIIEVETESDIA